MKRTKQTMLTAAVFAAALGLSSSGTAVSAALTFTPESQRTAAVLYGPPTPRGDIDQNWYLDARDLTLMKRHALGEATLTGIRFINADYVRDDVIDRQDISALLKLLLDKAVYSTDS